MGYLVDIDDEYDRILLLLNVLAPVQVGPAALWIVRRSQKERIDEMGVPVNRGERYFVRRDAYQRSDTRTLSLKSGRLLWELFIEDNQIKNRFLQKMMEAEETELRRMGHRPSSMDDFLELREKEKSDNDDE